VHQSIMFVDAYEWARTIGCLSAVSHRSPSDISVDGSTASTDHFVLFVSSVVTKVRDLRIGTQV
jgi:hypothetical protein